MQLADSHCHLDMLEGDIPTFIERAKQNGVAYILNVNVSMTKFPDILKTAMAHPFVFASVGLHPNTTNEEVTTETLLELGQHDKVIAIGETGLDYFRTTGDTTWQRDRFRRHIAAAKQLQKPLIIHTRDAKEDTIKVMHEEKANEVGGVMHCFSEDWHVAKQAMDLGFYISFSGVVTFKNATATQEVARQVPLDRMLIETDAPYLAPTPMRGKPNEPGYVRYTAEYIAALRNISLEEVAEQTTKNFFELFKGAKRQHV